VTNAAFLATISSMIAGTVGAAHQRHRHAGGSGAPDQPARR